MQETWKLEDIYKSKDDERLISDQALLKKNIDEFRSKYKDCISINNLKGSISDYEKIISLYVKISSYSFLYSCTKLDDDEALAFSQSITESLAFLYSKIVFFTVEITSLDYNLIESECEKDCELAKYKSWFENCFRFKDHMLENNAEEVLARKSVTANSSWIKMYDEILAKIEVDFEGVPKQLPELTELMAHSDDEKIREKAAKLLGKALKEVSFYIKHIYNNILLDWSIETDIRKYKTPETARHVSNNIDQESVNFLTDSVVAGFKKTSHKYYGLKAKLLGKEKLEYWDRNASVKLSSILDEKFPYDDGCKLVLDTFGSFSEIFENIAKNFIEKNWIDIYPKKGKCSGAFAHPCVPEIHPYVLLNYFDGMRDVSTLAHEVGHGIHMVLAAKNGILLSETPLTLAEVASLFSEKMLFEKIFEQAKTDQEKIDLLCSKLDDAINSIMRQISFFEFERRVHQKRAIKELSEEDISIIWMETLKESLGDHVNIDESIASYWCYISHFFHSPFYVYAYAFADIFVNALYKNYKETGADFVGKYIEMLSKGGIDKYDVAAAKFGLNPKKEEFWKNGVDVIAKQIDHLETLCDRALCN